MTTPLLSSSHPSYSTYVEGLNLESHSISVVSSNMGPGIPLYGLKDNAETALEEVAQFTLKNFPMLFQSWKRSS